jgi:hypothetical protein
VDVIPIIKYKDRPAQLLLIANFRPPVGKFVLEFPAGLLDHGTIEVSLSTISKMPRDNYERKLAIK